MTSEWGDKVKKIWVSDRGERVEFGDKVSE